MDVDTEFYTQCIGEFPLDSKYMLLTGDSPIWYMLNSARRTDFMSGNSAPFVLVVRDSVPLECTEELRGIIEHEDSCLVRVSDSFYDEILDHLNGDYLIIDNSDREYELDWFSSWDEFLGLELGLIENLSLL